MSAPRAEVMEAVADDVRQLMVALAARVELTLEEGTAALVGLLCEQWKHQGESRERFVEEVRGLAEMYPWEMEEEVAS